MTISSTGSNFSGNFTATTVNSSPIENKAPKVTSNGQTEGENKKKLIIGAAAAAALGAIVIAGIAITKGKGNKVVDKFANDEANAAKNIIKNGENIVGDFKNKYMDKSFSDLNSIVKNQDEYSKLSSEEHSYIDKKIGEAKKALVEKYEKVDESDIFKLTKSDEYKKLCSEEKYIINDRLSMLKNTPGYLELQGNTGFYIVGKERPYQLRIFKPELYENKTQYELMDNMNSLTKDIFDQGNAINDLPVNSNAYKHTMENLEKSIVKKEEIQKNVPKWIDELPLYDKDINQMSLPELQKEFQELNKINKYAGDLLNNYNGDSKAIMESESFIVKYNSRTEACNQIGKLISDKTPKK